MMKRPTSTLMLFPVYLLSPVIANVAIVSEGYQVFTHFISSQNIPPIREVMRNKVVLLAHIHPSSINSSAPFFEATQGILCELIKFRINLRHEKRQKVITLTSKAVFN